MTHHEYRMTDDARAVLRRLDEALTTEPTHDDGEACDCPAFPALTAAVRAAFDADAVIVIGGPANLAAATDLDPWALATALRTIADHVENLAGSTS